MVDGKQKISLGRGLVRADVNAIMFDEPLTMVDPYLKWQLRSKLKELHQRAAITVIYVIDGQTEPLTFADQVVVIPGRGGAGRHAGRPRSGDRSRCAVGPVRDRHLAGVRPLAIALVYGVLVFRYV